MGRDYHALFVDGEAHFCELVPARLDIVRRIVREEIEVPPALAHFFKKAVRAGDNVSVEIECPIHIDNKILRFFKNTLVCQNSTHFLSRLVYRAQCQILYHKNYRFYNNSFSSSETIFRHFCDLCLVAVYKYSTNF